MAKDEQLPRSTSGRAIEHGETYRHAEYGSVEVTGVWKRTQRLEMAHSTDEQDMIVVRYVPDDGEWIDELAESLDDFLDAID